MKYIDLPLPPTVRDVLTPWLGQRCWLDWTNEKYANDGDDDIEIPNNFSIENEFGDSISFETLADIGEFQDIGFAIKANEENGATLWKICGSQFMYGVGNRFWNRCEANVEDVLKMMCDDWFLEWFDATDWPSELSDVLGKSNL